MMRSALYVLAVALIAASIQSALNAQAITEVPEIDGGSVMAGLGLLSGGVLILRARFGRR